MRPAMLRIRTRDDATLEFAHRTEQFGRMNRRGSVVVGFTMSGGAPEFMLAELETKMIPKACMDELEGVPFKLLSLDGGGWFIVQDPGNTLKVLRHEDNGWFETVALDDITEDDDVAVYDAANRDWALSSVKEMKIIMRDPAGGEIEDALAKGASAELSRYMIKADYGLVLGGVLII